MSAYTFNLCGISADKLGCHGLSCRSNQGRASPHEMLNNVIICGISKYSQQTGTIRPVQSWWKLPWWGDHDSLVKWEVLGVGRHLCGHLLWLPPSSNCQGTGWGSGACRDWESQEVCPSRPSIPVPTNRSGNLWCGWPRLHVLSPQPWQENAVSHRRPHLFHPPSPAYLCGNPGRQFDFSPGVSPWPCYLGSILVSILFVLSICLVSFC